MKLYLPNKQTVVSKWNKKGKGKIIQETKGNISIRNNNYKKALDKLFEVSKLCSNCNLRSTTTTYGSTIPYIETIRRFLAHIGTPSRNSAYQKKIDRQALLSDVLKTLRKLQQN